MQATAPADVAALLPRLQETCDAALEAATAQLKTRGRQEAEALKEALRRKTQGASRGGCLGCAHGAQL